MKKVILVLAVSALFSSSAFAIKGFLKSESTSGMYKYCRYSNGVVITIKSHQLCPMSVDGP